MKDLSFTSLARFLTEQSMAMNEPLEPPVVDDETVIALEKFRPQLLEDIAESMGLLDDDLED